MATREPPLRHSWVARGGPVARLVARPIREFLDTESAGGLVLLAATIVALAWANSPLGETYESFWHIEGGIRIGDLQLREDLRHWVNDGLMTLFFFVVGLEIKRELVTGELNDVRKAAMPALAALGGMVMPALLYLSLNAGGRGAVGWGIPMATDIAFTVGLLSLFGRGCPSSLKVFLLSLAIVDDIAAIVVIAIFYTANIHLGWLIAALVLFLAAAVMRRMRVWYMPAYVVVGALTWLATLESGVHATIAGVALGLLAPARPADPQGAADALRETRRLVEDPDPSELRATTMQAQELVSVAERLEHSLHPWSGYVVIPLFALANAGLALSGGALIRAARSSVAIGIVLGLVVGKLTGILAFSWLATRSGVGSLPEGVGWRHLTGAAAVAGVGFTVSLFIAGLAFGEAPLAEQAKMGIFAASVIAGSLGAVLLSLASRRPFRGFSEPGGGETDT